MTRGASAIVRSAIAVLILLVLVPLPTRPQAYAGGDFISLTVDLAIVILILFLIPRLTGLLRAGIVAVLMALTLLRLADLGMIMAFQRRFNPVLDLHLLASAWDLGAGTFGAALMALAVAGAVLGLVALSTVFFWALGGLPRLARGPRLAIAACMVPVLVFGSGPILPGEISARIERLGTSFAEETRFAADLGEDSLATPDFAALKGRDVIFIFVESYGRAWLDLPDHADVARARLASAQAHLARAGFSARSGWVRSPTRGGQSWLAHGAVMSGLWTSSQSRYDALIASERLSLNRLLGQAGWHSVAIMPAITRAWPEARWFGYDAVFAKDDLGYRGEPFEWVTMPDQYTLSAMDRLGRTAGADVIEVALISSHAPWTPLPEIVPWDRVGDGAIFDGTRRRGGTPKEVWASPDTIRAAWSRSLDYALEVVAQWVARSADDALIVVLGDHQPAPLVAGEDASAAVPIHVISRDDDLLKRLPGRWARGMLPESDLPEREMSALRALFATCYSTPGCDAPE